MHSADGDESFLPRFLELRGVEVQTRTSSLAKNVAVNREERVDPLRVLGVGE